MSQQPDAFDLIRSGAEEAGWSEASQIILLCHFLDQIQERSPGTEDDGILGDFARYLDEQAQQERDIDPIVFTNPEPLKTLVGIMLPAQPNPLLFIDFEEPGLEKVLAWKRAVSMDETTQGLYEWESE